MKKEEFIPYLETIIREFDKEKLIDTILLLAMNSEEDGLNKIENIVFGKSNFGSINELKKEYNKNEIAIFLNEIDDALINLNKINKGDFKLFKEVNEEWDDWYDDLDDEFIYHDHNSFLSHVNNAINLIIKGMRLGLTKELIDLAKTLIHLNVKEVDEDNNVEELMLSEVYYELNQNNLIEENLSEIIYLLYASLPLDEASKEIIYLIQRDVFGNSHLIKFINENYLKITNLDEFICSICGALSASYASSRKQEIIFIKEIYNLLDLVHDKEKLKTALLDLTPNDPLILIYLVKYFKFEEKYLSLINVYLNTKNKDKDISETLIYLALDKLHEIDNENLKLEFFKLSLSTSPSLELFKAFEEFDNKEFKEVAYKVGTNLITKKKAGGYQREKNSLGYLFLLLLNKKEEFFKYIKMNDSLLDIGSELIEVLVNIMIKENVDYVAINRCKDPIYINYMFDAEINMLSDLIEERNKPELLEYIKCKVEFSELEAKRCFEIISDFTYEYTRFVTSRKSRYEYKTVAFYINLTAELNAYINKVDKKIVIKQYMKEFYRFHALTYQINSSEYNELISNKDTDRSSSYDFDDDELPF